MEEVAYYIIGGVGTMLNAIVLITLGTSKSQTHKGSRPYFLHQAGIDLCASVLLIPNTHMAMHQYADESHFLCMAFKVMGNVAKWSFLVSGTYNLVVTSFDRYSVRF